jgi:thymidylate synthase
MKTYLDLVRDVLENGSLTKNSFRSDRTGVGTLSVFGRQVRFNLQDGFPLLTTKKVHLKSVIHELLWFIKGDTNINYLNENGVTIWDEWADINGDLGPIYGKQWRSWGVQGGKQVDQLQNVINELKNNPFSRRLLVIAYNPAELPDTAPPACHTLFQFYVSDKGLSLQLYQRSADLMLGVPFNIASYALLLLMVAQVVDLPAYEFIHTFGDLHIYSNHIDGAIEQLSRTPKPLPKINLNPNIKSIFEFKYTDFKIENYVADPVIRFPIAV